MQHQSTISPSVRVPAQPFLPQETHTHVAREGRHHTYHLSCAGGIQLQGVEEIIIQELRSSILSQANFGNPPRPPASGRVECGFKPLFTEKILNIRA
eukprot:gnl/MRDRNA2_/MRDRNA2_80296_c0_seq2.p1 gnl/MRDRNA2_/MRDRNA2_80296_c0~~gnl/MRDRNA2_/MRDRNA2_80296_c0_seq2.p1  ORF type:complete len:107 (-),score=1.73 gnl/MRDRNA2_/MRDRNA2_80296_c0_seq2:47-337(-)